MSYVNSPEIQNEDNNLKNENKDILQINSPQENLNNDTNGSVLVIILQCETKGCDVNINNLKWIFSDPYFIVQVCVVDPPPITSIPSTLSKAEYLENYCMRKALLYASEGPYLENDNNRQLNQFNSPQYLWNKLPCIIVKDSSVSNITPEGYSINNGDESKYIGGMKDRIQVALDKAKQADLFYLCKWNDQCSKYKDVSGVGSINHGSTLKWSISPSGTQAIMYTPTARDFVQNALITSTVSLGILLNNYIAKGQLLATVFVPNIIDFDMDLATSNNDYFKLNECAPPPTTTTTTRNVTSLLWFIIIIAIILLIAWALISLVPQSDSSIKTSI